MEPPLLDDAGRRLAALARSLERAQAALRREAAAVADTLASARSAMDEQRALAAGGVGGLAAVTDALVQGLGQASRAIDNVEVQLPHQAERAQQRLARLHEDELAAGAALEMLKGDMEIFREATNQAFAECAAGDLEGVLSPMAEASQTVIDTCSAGLALAAAEAVLGFAERFGESVDAATAEALTSWAQRAEAMRRQSPTRSDAEASSIPTRAWAEKLLSTMRDARQRMEQQADELRRELDTRETLLRAGERVADTWSPLSQLEALKKTLRRIKDVTAAINPFD